MSIKNYKILFWGLIMGWAALCFVLFGQKLQSEFAQKKAQNSIELTRSFFAEHSKQLKFKLGQWAYNYELKSTKGVAFDKQAFMDSDFDLIGFYQEQPDKGFSKQWTKSKDFAPSSLPESIQNKIAKTSSEELKNQTYKWFAGLDKQGQAFMVLGFYVNDNAMGRGLIVGSVDMKLMPYENLSSNTFILDQEGRYLLHPQKEYLAQKSLLNLKDLSPNHLVQKDSQYWFEAPNKTADSKIIYREPKLSTLSLLGFALLVMLLGLGLLTGIPMILREDELVPEEPKYKAGEAVGVNQSDIDFVGYESVLKVQSLREKLNKMSLLSSSLKGRLELIEMGDFDDKLLGQVQSDFAALDKDIDLAFNEASELEGNQEENSDKVNKPHNSEAQMLKAFKAHKTSVDETKTEGANASTAIGSKSKFEAKTSKSSEQNQENSKSTQTPAFEIKEEDIDLDFADSLSLDDEDNGDGASDVDSADTDTNTNRSASPVATGAATNKDASQSEIKDPQEEEDMSAQETSASNTPRVVKEQASNAYGSYMVSESLEEAKFALDSLGKDEDLLMDIDDNIEAVDLSESSDNASGRDAETNSNASPATKASAGASDWSKVIAELTEELNNLDLDFDEMESTQKSSMQSKPNEQEKDAHHEEKKTEDNNDNSFKPPRVEI